MPQSPLKGLGVDQSVPSEVRNHKGFRIIPSKISAVDTKRKTACNVAILGFGTVGTAVARILSERAPAYLRLTHVCNRNVARKKVNWLPTEVEWTEEFNRVLHSDADVIVELIGGLQPAEQWIRGALMAGKSVVTANKQVIAEYGPELLNLAAQRNCQLVFGAAVAGGVPVISGLDHGLAGDEISAICGILNGTCNYILSAMENSDVPFSTALSEAQKRGYAEADPTDDIDGLDARAKLVILARIGLHANLTASSICCRSISKVEAEDFVCAERLGCTIRQVSRAELQRGILFASVQPSLVRRYSPMALTRGSQNVVVCTGKFGGETIFQGQGAGGNATAVAVVSDILSIARKSDAGLNGFGPDHPITPEVSSDFVTAHYLRLVAADTGVILPTVLAILDSFGIAVSIVFQGSDSSNSNSSLVITLKPCKTSSVDRALQRINRQDAVKATLTLPIFN